MSNFTNKAFTKNDEWYTPHHAWEDIQHFIPRELTVCDPFYGDGTSGHSIRNLGFNTIHEDVDFFTNNNLGDIIISNPPFSLIQKVMVRLFEIDLPFIMIMPSSKINTQYASDWLGKGIQLIVPSKRINFVKKTEDGKVSDKKSSCNFDCFYYCYKMKLEKDIIRLPDKPLPNKPFVKLSKRKRSSDIDEEFQLNFC